MRRHLLLPAMAFVAAVAACDVPDPATLPLVGRFFAQETADTAAADTARARAAAPTDTARQPAAAPQAQQPQQRRPPTPATTPARQERRTAPAGPALADQPWTPTHTGTVRPGMTREEVVTVWGPPVAERTIGARGYLYFRNGCEVTCGTFDVVFLENGQVVDAIVRAPGHTYAGVSSSPPDRTAEYTPPERRRDNTGTP